MRTTPTRPTTSCRGRSRCSGTDLNPHYFANPPAFTYVLHYLFAIAYGGRQARDAFAHDPKGVYTLSRVPAAVLGTIALWLLYATGARLFNRAVGLLAAAIEAVAFLPVFYAHLALNDVPTLAPLTLSLLGSAGVLRKGRKRDYVLAGVGLGLACATKYTAGIVLVPFVSRRLATRYLDATAGARAAVGRRALLGLRARSGALRARGVPSREPVLAARLQELSRRNSCISRRSRRKRRGSSARRGRAASSTTCGR